ncbi:VOC family protein, partial [Streptomyces sp. NPDC049577]
MLTSTYAPGGPSRLVLETPDAKGAADFYGGVLGWDFRPGPPGAGEHGSFRLDGRTVAGLAPP